MAPELPREQDTRRRAPPKRRLSAHDQEPDGISNKRARVEDDSSQSQYTSSTHSASSTHPSHARRATTTAPSEENLAGTWQFPASNTPTLTVVERAAILSAHLPFSTHRQFSILDTSFGATCQTNFCAQIEGFEGMWVAKLSYRDLFDELVRHVLGEDNTRRLCLIAVGEEPSQVMGGRTGGSQLPGHYDRPVHIIVWPQPESSDCVAGPAREINLSAEGGSREFVEMIGGCWME